MQFTSYQKKAGAWGLIAAVTAFSLWLLAPPVPTPFVMAGLHLAVIFALLAFRQLFGFVGVLIALPASAVLLVALRRGRDGYLTSRLYQG